MNENTSTSLTAPRSHNRGGAAIGIGFVILIGGLLLTPVITNFVNASFAALTGNTNGQTLVNNVPIFWIMVVVFAGLGLIGWGAFDLVKR